ncbi:hypothetical protein N7452_001158 [Penicillium brevicompactum]|uniref:Uncharacterized protein n=1 Tax=Penicillium brevicompactum TaxID=5074 RepID=A0A9W9R422_PENBR|nr:hypothetical protein N7452_001158 [Penicillium brevicompactum]
MTPDNMDNVRRRTEVQNIRAMGWWDLTSGQTILSEQSLQMLSNGKEGYNAMYQELYCRDDIRGERLFCELANDGDLLLRVKMGAAL